MDAIRLQPLIISHPSTPKIIGVSDVQGGSIMHDGLEFLPTEA